MNEQSNFSSYVPKKEELSEKDKKLNTDETIIKYLSENHPGSTEGFCEILYMFGKDPTDIQGITYITCDTYQLPATEARRICLEYVEYYRTKKNQEERDQKQRDEEEKLQSIIVEMRGISLNPEIYNNNSKISEYLNKWKSTIKESSPIPKVVNFLECEKIEIETVIKIGFIEIPKGITCCIHAPGGTGKSILLQRAIMASGVRSCFISGEDSSGIMANLLYPYKKFYTNNNSDFAHFDNQNIDGIIEFIQNSSYKLYVIDPLSSFCTGDKWGNVETENGTAAELLRIFNGITAKSGKTIIYTHHESKGATDIRTAARGSSALVDNARMGISIHRLSEEMRPPHKSNKNRHHEEDVHKNNVRSFQSYLTRSLQNTKDIVFRSQKAVGVVNMTCHKNNYGPVGGTASYILTANMSSLGLNVVPAEKYYNIINDAVRDSFDRGDIA